MQLGLVASGALGLLFFPAIVSVGSGVAASAGTSGALALFGSGAGVAGYKGVTGSQARSAAARAEGMATKKIKVKCPSVGCVHEQRIEVPLDQNLSGSSWECVECGRRFEVRQCINCFKRDTVEVLGEGQEEEQAAPKACVRKGGSCGGTLSTDVFVHAS